MPVGESNYDRIKKDALKWRPENIERSAWFQVILAVLTQLNAEASFPSYNVVLGFWGLYVAFTRSFQACNVYLWFLGLSLLLDIVFCALWGE
jgi:hypothetical protein